MWVLWLPRWTITPLSPETRRTDGKYQQWESEEKKRSSSWKFSFKLPSIMMLDLRCGTLLRSIASVRVTALCFPTHAYFLCFFSATDSFSLKISSIQHQQPAHCFSSSSFMAAFACICCPLILCSWLVMGNILWIMWSSEQVCMRSISLCHVWWTRFPRNDSLTHGPSQTGRGQRLYTQWKKTVKKRESLRSKASSTWSTVHRLFS